MEHGVLEVIHFKIAMSHQNNLYWVFFYRKKGKPAYIF